jgi:hypothetical protein
MAQNDGKIVNSWNLIAFARRKGKMQVAQFKNAEGTEFKSCIFTDNDGNRTFVRFSTNLGEMTPAEIVAQKADLQVVERMGDDGETRFILSKTGQNNWQDVDLGL